MLKKSLIALAVASVLSALGSIIFKSVLAKD